MIVTCICHCVLYIFNFLANSILQIANAKSFWMINLHNNKCKLLSFFKSVTDVICIPNLSFNFRNEPKLVTWDLKVRQMGLQKKDLANIMVKELDLTCTPQQYLDESEKLHKTLFPEVCIIMVARVVEFPREG